MFNLTKNGISLNKMEIHFLESVVVRCCVILVGCVESPYADVSMISSIMIST